MKYKKLEQKELIHLEKEFITFLASNQIIATDWEKLKAEKSPQVDELIEIFSDIVYSKVLSKINYLERRAEKEISVYFFDEKSIKLVGVKIPPHLPINLSSSNFCEQLKNIEAGATLFSNEKAYQKEKEQEIFELLETGCLVTDDKFFNLLASLMAKK
jgi:hypothetical protein